MDGSNTHWPAWRGTMSYPSSVTKTCSPFPPSRQFLVEDRKKLLTEVNIQHTQDLFSARVTCFADQSRLDCVAVTIVSSSEDQVGKAEVSGWSGPYPVL